MTLDDNNVAKKRIAAGMVAIIVVKADKWHDGHKTPDIPVSCLSYLLRHLLSACLGQVPHRPRLVVVRIALGIFGNYGDASSGGRLAQFGGS